MNHKGITVKSVTNIYYQFKFLKIHHNNIGFFPGCLIHMAMTVCTVHIRYYNHHKVLYATKVSSLAVDVGSSICRPTNFLRYCIWESFREVLQRNFLRFPFSRKQRFDFITTLLFRLSRLHPYVINFLIV